MCPHALNIVGDGSRSYVHSSPDTWQAERCPSVKEPNTGVGGQSLLIETKLFQHSGQEATWRSTDDN
jgi:hypothetical protein